ncbi:MAG: TonB-dependent receptor [Candidatus Binatia bacterium]|nr:TonB-dependent receptor [Candidatus Binatia bacterium]
MTRGAGAVAVCVAIVVLHVLAAEAGAQAPTAPEAPAEYQRQGLPATDPSGTTDEVDAATAEVEAAAAGEPTGLDHQAKSRIEEIVVRARRRAEALEDTPVSVTALNASNLRDSGIYRLDQVAELVPNLQYTNNIVGNLATFRIRGVGTANWEIQFDPGVAIYLDGVFLPRASGSLLSVVDVQQVEVLRGPQGTLFGKNSVGGAINMTTVKPQPNFEGFALVRPGNFSSLETQVMLNIPIFEDRVLSRFAFFTANRNGYLFNTAQNTTYNNRDEMTFLGGLRFLVDDATTIDLTGTWGRSHVRSRGGKCIVVDDDAALSPLYGPQFYPECRRTTLFENDQNIQGLSDIESYGTWGVLNHEIGELWELDDLSVKAIGAWNEQRPRVRFDVDGTSADVVWQSTAGGSVFDGRPGEQQQVSGELQLNGSALDGRLVFVTGLFAQWETATDERATNVGPPLNQHNTNASKIKNWTWAPYLQATADVTDWLSLTGGIRYTEDKKSLLLTQFVPDTGQVLLKPVSDSRLFTAWTPMASIASTLPEDLLPGWTDHLMGYFTYSQGFKGGGFNALPGGQNEEGVDALAAPFEPETLESFEIGFKTILFDNRLTFNASFFLAKYEDIQRISARIVGEGPEGIPIYQRITENAAEATTKGFELETLAYPIDGLQITGNIGVTDARYDDFPDAISALTDEIIDRSGERFNRVPEFTSFVAVQYSLAVEADGPEILTGWLTPRLEWYYQSSMFVTAPELVDTFQPGYNLLNARLSYVFWDDRAQIALWGKNLADQTYIDFTVPAVSTFGFLVNYPGLPRTWGGEISYRF